MSPQFESDFSKNTDDESIADYMGGPRIPSQIQETVAMMERFGGSFVQQLAALYQKGDPDNRTKIVQTWHGYFINYAYFAGQEQVRKQYDRIERKDLTGIDCPLDISATLGAAGLGVDREEAHALANALIRAVTPVLTHRGIDVTQPETTMNSLIDTYMYILATTTLAASKEAP